MEYLADYALFLAKAVTLVVAILVVVFGIVASVVRQRRSPKGKLVIEHLNKEYEEMERRLSSALRSDHELREDEKAERKQEKQEAKQAKKRRKGKGADEAETPRVFVIDFDGDIRASAVDTMRKEISAALTVADERDEILVRLESAGGLVHSYGLAASQLQRIRDAKIPLTIAIDRVAASGGYMMACVGDKVLSAPFAIIGSIGVIAQIPNIHRLLKKHDIDVEQHYAGEYKRTLTLIGENTDKGRAKLKEELESTHALFRDFISENRPQLDVDRVATGETWYGRRAIELGLVDVVQTSDAYLMGKRNDAELVHLSYKERKGLVDSMGSMMRSALAQRDKLQRDCETPLLM